MLSKGNINLPEKPSLSKESPIATKEKAIRMLHKQTRLYINVSKKKVDKNLNLITNLHQ